MNTFIRMFILPFLAPSVLLISIYNDAFPAENSKKNIVNAHMFWKTTRENVPGWQRDIAWKGLSRVGFGLGWTRLFRSNLGWSFELGYLSNQQKFRDNHIQTIFVRKIFKLQKYLLSFLYLKKINNNLNCYSGAGLGISLVHFELREWLVREKSKSFIAEVKFGILMYDCFYIEMNYCDQLHSWSTLATQYDPESANKIRKETLNLSGGFFLKVGLCRRF